MYLTIVGYSNVVSRLPEVFAGQDVTIRVIGLPSNPLRNSKFVDEFIMLKNPKIGDSIRETLLANPAALDKIEGLVCYQDDETTWEIANSSLPFDTKTRILPAKNLIGLEMLGSKAGFVRVANSAEASIPRSLVVEEVASLSQALQEIGFPCLVKGDLGGGGNKIRKIKQLHEIIESPVEPNWYPVVVQEFVEGLDVSAEVCFFESKLIGWTYSEVRKSAGAFGPSTYRNFQVPHILDFEESLVKIGKTAGLNGMFNTSLIWDESENRHLLFEFDPRPNAWHQFGPQLGLNWIHLYKEWAESGARSIPERGPKVSKEIHLYPREIRYGIQHLSWSALRPWLFRHAGTWETRNHADKVVNRNELFETFGRWLLNLLRTMYLRLPRRWRLKIESLGLKRPFLKIFGIQI